ncbi:MAG: hypothetical protein KIT48_00425 [Pseudolabrys sp.]|nr:hypothetical protein [Pseudolabrys sp.]
MNRRAKVFAAANRSALALGSTEAVTVDGIAEASGLPRAEIEAALPAWRARCRQIAARTPAAFLARAKRQAEQLWITANLASETDVDESLTDSGSEGSPIDRTDHESALKKALTMLADLSAAVAEMRASRPRKPSGRARTPIRPASPAPKAAKGRLKLAELIEMRKPDEAERLKRRFNRQRNPHGSPRARRPT